MEALGILPENPSDLNCTSAQVQTAFKQVGFEGIAKGNLVETSVNATCFYRAIHNQYQEDKGTDLQSPLRLRGNGVSQVVSSSA